MSWERSGTADMMHAARRVALSVSGGIESYMDAKDPTGQRRYGYTPDGEPEPWDPDQSPTTLDYMMDWQGKLKRLNSMLWELESRLTSLLAAGGERGGSDG